MQGNPQQECHDQRRYGCIGVSHFTSRPTLHSSLPGKLTSMDYMRGSLASSFLLDLVHGRAPIGHEQKGGEYNPGIYPVGSLPVESPQAVPNQTLNSH